MDKNKKVVKIVKYILVVLGSLILAFGNIAFLSPLSINAGGLNGFGVIANQFISEEFKDIVYNIVVNSLTAILWIIGLIFIGKEFSFKTLISTISFIICNILFTMVPGISDMVKNISNALKPNGTTDAGSILLGGIFGGFLVGFGVSITYVGGGSTGGVDVISFIMEKYLHLKQSIGSFLVDSTIIIVGLLVIFPFDSTILIPCLSGIISAFISSLVIEFIFIGLQASYQADIISEKWEIISRYVQDELGRGATIIPVKGGYKKEDKIMLRVIVDKIQYRKLKEFIASIDEKAFITYSETKAVFGEGFAKYKLLRKKK